MTKRLYCGGNFEFLYKDFTPEKLESDYRTHILGDLNKILHQPSCKYVPLSYSLDYIGPFYFYENDLDGAGVVLNEYRMVDRCTHAVFLIDNTSIPGTVAELVHASILDKDITVFYVERTQDQGEPEQEICNMNWYPLEIAKHIGNARLIKCKSREEAKELIYQYVESLKQE